MNPTDVSKYA